MHENKSMPRPEYVNDILGAMNDSTGELNVILRAVYAGFKSENGQHQTLELGRYVFSFETVCKLQEILSDLIAAFHATQAGRKNKENNVCFGGPDD